METDQTLKDALILILDELPPSQVAEVLDFARFIKSKTPKKGQTILKVSSFDDLQPLIGTVALGGDAVADCDSACG